MDDLISRRAAIDALDGNVIVTSRESAQAVMDYIRECADRIRSLPSAQPDHSGDVNGKVDLIDRQAAIDALENTKTAISENGERYIAKQNAIMRIDALPSAQPEPSQVARDIARIMENEQDMRIQPKRGKWILDRSGAYCCSECMEPCATYVMMKPRDKFCKMCGSRNEASDGND